MIIPIMPYHHTHHPSRHIHHGTAASTCSGQTTALETGRHVAPLWRELESDGSREHVIDSFSYNCDGVGCVVRSVSWRRVCSSPYIHSSIIVRELCCAEFVLAEGLFLIVHSFVTRREWVVLCGVCIGGGFVPQFRGIRGIIIHPSGVLQTRIIITHT